MRIGIPKEVKAREGRVALIPAAVEALAREGHDVLVQAGAGAASGYGDAEYARAGARLAPDAAALYNEAELVLKVKEPQPAEYALLRREHVLFSFLALPTNRGLTQALLSAGLTAIAFESLEEGGRLPLLAPMSDIAGRLAVQIGATLLHGHRGGRGVLLGGTGGTESGNVVVLGGGVAGRAAAAAASALGARATVFVRREPQIESLAALGARITARLSEPAAIDRAVRGADLLIGALRVADGVAPKLVSADTVRRMTSGSAIVDICIDQGGCVETIRPTSYDAPTYVEHGVTHFAVPNMPGAVPRTASQALSSALAPYAAKLARVGRPRLHEEEALVRAVNVADGRIVHPAVAAAFGPQ